MGEEDEPASVIIENTRDHEIYAEALERHQDHLEKIIEGTRDRIVNLKERTKRRKSNVIYLYDTRILPYVRPVEAEIREMHLGKPQDGRTDIQRFLNFTPLFKERFGPYKILASAARYRASIALLYEGRRSKKDRERPTNPTREMVLFAGAVLIFKNQIIPGTEIEFPDLLTKETGGRIWYAASNTPEYRGLRGLRKVIFGSADSEREKIARIEAIEWGYETQREERKIWVSGEDLDKYLRFRRKRERKEEKPLGEAGGTY